MANKLEENMTKEELLDFLPKSSLESSPKFETVKMRIFSKCTEEIVRAMDEASRASSRLGERIYWLNGILAVATAVMAIATVLLVFKK